MSKKEIEIKHNMIELWFKNRFKQFGLIKDAMLVFAFIRFWVKKEKDNKVKEKAKMIWISFYSLAFLAVTVTSMDFSYELPVKKIQCFGDSLGKFILKSLGIFIKLMNL